MAKIKNDNRAKLFIALIGLIGIVIGTFGTWFVKQYLMPSDPAMAKVQKFENIYIFIRSRPLSDHYTSLGIVETNVLLRAIESTENKKRIGDIAKSIGQSLLGELPFENRLKYIVQQARKENPQVEGLIFSDDLTECEQIKFKP